VPHSGSWVSDGVFAIAAGMQDEETLTSPGLLLFECSPLEGLDDELEGYCSICSSVCASSTHSCSGSIEYWTTAPAYVKYSSLCRTSADTSHLFSSWYGAKRSRPHYLKTWRRWYVMLFLVSAL
jgi:hypothetical protein